MFKGRVEPISIEFHYIPILGSHIPFYIKPNIGLSSTTLYYVQWAPPMGWSPHTLRRHIDLGAILGIGWQVKYQWHVTNMLRIEKTINVVDAILSANKYSQHPAEQF